MKKIVKNMSFLVFFFLPVTSCNFESGTQSPETPESEKDYWENHLTVAEKIYFETLIKEHGLKVLKVYIPKKNSPTNTTYSFEIQQRERFDFGIKDKKRDSLLHEVAIELYNTILEDSIISRINEIEIYVTDSPINNRGQHGTALHFPLDSLKRR